MLMKSEPDKYVAGKKRHLHFNLAAIAPLVKSAITRKEALDLTTDKLVEAFFSWRG